MRLHRLEIPVSDLDRAFRFYTQVLGFPVIGRNGDASANLFLGDVHGGMVTLVRSAQPPGTGVVVVFAVDGIDEAKAALQAKGARFLGAPAEDPLGVTVRFLDSEGNQLAIFDGTISARIRQQGTRPVAELASRLGEVEQRARAVFHALEEAGAAWVPAPGEWPIVGQAAHMIDSLVSCGLVAGDLAAGRQPSQGQMLRESYPAAPVTAVTAELWQAFADARSWLARLPDDPPGTATLAHGVFGPLDAKGWVAFMLFHLRLHLAQVEAIKGAPGYPGTA